MNSRVRTSISATLAEIEQTHKTLGIPVEEDEFCEAWGVITSIERRFVTTGIDGDRRWSPRKAG